MNYFGNISQTWTNIYNLKTLYFLIGCGYICLTVSTKTIIRYFGK